METTRMQAEITTGFRAFSEKAHGFGATPGEALSALMAHLPGGQPFAPIVILPFNRGDVFFSDSQQERLRELKTRQETLSPQERDELEELIAAAFDATIARTQAIQNIKA